jgi:hypothetical protein
MNEEAFLQAAVEQIGTVVKTPMKTLDKDTFIKVFKYTGDFAKFKNADFKRDCQVKRCEHFNSDPKLYLNALK